MMYHAISVYLLIICNSVINLSLAKNDWIKVLIKRDTNRYCGKHLVTALQLLCDGVYNPMFKKSINYNDDVPDLDNHEGTSHPRYFKDKRMVMSLESSSFQRNTRGVYDECCQKSCNLLEMASYCGEELSTDD